MKSQNYSIKKQLILLISVPVIFLAIIVGGLSVLSAYEEIEEVSDAQLAHSAKVLLQLTEHEVGEHEFYEIELGNERPELAHRYENKLTFRIWKDNHLVTKSHRAEMFKDFYAPPGFSDRVIAGEEWRFFVFIDAKTNITIEVAEKNEVRTELIVKILIGIFVPLSLFIPLLIIIIWYGVAKCLAPIVTLSQGVDRREINDFTEIEISFVPQEIHPLIKAINRLLKRIQDNFERERHFTDNAAHELRTPLAAMKTQTQVLMKKATDMPDCKDGLDNLHAAIERASHMVDQLLSFARLQADNIEFGTVNLSGLAEDVLMEILPLAVKKNLKICADIVPDITVKGNHNALTIMLRNLIDNAIKFTPVGEKINITILKESNKVTLLVSDTGPGIADIEKEKVFERFYRIQKNKQGSGLGLSMVEWVCDVHDADFSLSDNAPSGLLVTVTMEGI